MRKIIYLSWQDIEEAVNNIALQVGEVSGIYAIPRGGLCAGVMLSYKLNIPLVNNIGLSVLVIDDICDSGKTIGNFLRIGLKVACLVNLSDQEIISAIKLPKDSWAVFPWESKENAKNDLKEYENKRNI